MGVVDPNFFSKTKKARRVQILNFPLYLGISKEEVKQLFNNAILDLYLNEPGNNSPIHSLDFDMNNNIIILEITSVEEATRLFKISMITVMGITCKISRCSESMFGEEDDLMTKVKNAQVN